MRLPASITAQAPDATQTPPLAATHVDPTEVSDVQSQPPTDERKPWWARVSGAIVASAFTNVAAALIAVTGAVYVGMYHAPWVKNLASHTPTATQAGDAMGVAVAAAPASAATPAASAPAASATTGAAEATAATVAQSEPAQPASPDRVAAARDRMEQRIYTQVPARARTVAESETMNDEAPALEGEGRASRGTRRHHRGVRHGGHGAPWNAAWYKGA